MWFERFRRRRKLDQMARDLGVTLRQRYGARRHYRPADIYASGALLGLSGAMLGYGLALYCTREDFEHATRGASGAGDYDQLRAGFESPERYNQLPGDSGPWDSGSNQVGGGEVTDTSDGGSIGSTADSGDAGNASDGGVGDGGPGDGAGDGGGGDGGGGGGDGGD